MKTKKENPEKNTNKGYDDSLENYEKGQYGTEYIQYEDPNGPVAQFMKKLKERPVAKAPDPDEESFTDRMSRIIKEIEAKRERMLKEQRGKS